MSSLVCVDDKELACTGVGTSFSAPLTKLMAENVVIFATKWSIKYKEHRGIGSNCLALCCTRCVHLNFNLSLIALSASIISTVQCNQVHRTEADVLSALFFYLCKVKSVHRTPKLLWQIGQAIGDLFLLIAKFGN